MESSGVCSILQGCSLQTATLQAQALQWIVFSHYSEVFNFHLFYPHYLAFILSLIFFFLALSELIKVYKHTMPKISVRMSDTRTPCHTYSKFWTGPVDYLVLRLENDWIANREAPKSTLLAPTHFWIYRVNMALAFWIEKNVGFCTVCLKCMYLEEI